MVGHGMFVSGTEGATFFDCTEVTGAMLVFCITGQFGGACAPAKTGHGYGKDNYHHEKGNIFSVKRSPHASFTSVQTFMESQDIRKTKEIKD